MRYSLLSTVIQLDIVSQHSTKLYLDRFKKKKVDTLNVVKTYFLLRQMIVYYHVESLEDGQMTSPSFFV